MSVVWLRTQSSEGISIAKYLSGGIYPHIKFERDRLNIFRVRVFTSSGSTGGRGRGGDAKTIISPNAAFGDIIITTRPLRVYVTLLFPYFSGRLMEAHMGQHMSQDTEMPTLCRSKTRPSGAHNSYIS